ncbi:DEAD/DEAH box helicase [Halobacillus mangrovi]|nr:DEAD/DEAH box helicase [Halobacillus mangrovi]
MVHNNMLGINSSKNDFILPTAKEVFLAQFKNQLKVRGLLVKKPSDELKELNFSRFPLKINLRIKPISQKGNISLLLEVICKVNSIEYNLKENFEKDCDHIIINQTWYPIVQGSMTEIRSLLEKSGVSRIGNISFQQYLTLRRTQEPIIQDEVSKLTLNKGSIIDNNKINIPLFKGTLYPYQFQGYRWLRMISKESVGCILADEMGLGKTAQVIALVASETLNTIKPSLVVAPVTLLENWRREVKKFAPSLNTIIHQGNNRTGFYKHLRNHHLVITSYETVLRDFSLFLMLDWNIVIVDEAQAIKNPHAKRTKAIKQIRRRTSIAVTGTPVENHLLDLWSLADFAFPGFLGDLHTFQSTYQNEVISAESLEPIISPILLRREVKDVADDLPERIDIPQMVGLTDSESQDYETIRQQAKEEYGRSASLVSLIRLRMYCTHPLLCTSERQDPAQFSKYLRLVEILEEIVVNNEKAIIFTSFTRMADILLNDLSQRFEIPCDFIDGRVDVEKRQDIIDKFSSVKGPALLILNPRAAGAGLNITAANHVIHYNLEWNPAIEDQASARAYRKGQKRPVNIYRLFCSNTVEEAIDSKLQKKRELSESVVIGTDGSSFDNSDILEALSKTPVS